MLTRPYTASDNAEQELADRILQIAERMEMNPKRCLDVGCGRGYLLQQLQVYNFCKILGLEYDASTPKIDEFVLDQAAVTGTFDLITCVHSLDRLEDPAEAVRWMAGKIEPGGTILLEQPYSEAFTHDGLKQMLDKLGLKYLFLNFEVGCDIFIGDQYADATSQKVYYSFDSPDMTSQEQYMHWLMKQYGRTA